MKPNIQVWFSNRRAKWRRHNQQTPQQQNRVSEPGLTSPHNSTIGGPTGPILGSIFRPYNELISNFILQNGGMIPGQNPAAGLHGNPGRTETPSSDHGNAKQEPDEPQIDVD